MGCNMGKDVRRTSFSWMTRGRMIGSKVLPFPLKLWIMRDRFPVVLVSIGCARFEIARTHIGFDSDRLTKLRPHVRLIRRRLPSVFIVL